MADSFQYQPLHKDGIRLLRILSESTPDEIHCALEHHAFHSFFYTGPAYHALSYCWGELSMTRTIILDGRPFEVTANLWDALSAIIRHHTTTSSDLYWIDAICIDQSHLAEKNEQVHQMWRIYSHAEMVYAWIGQEHDDIVDGRGYIQRHRDGRIDREQEDTAEAVDYIQRYTAACERRTAETASLDRGDPLFDRENPPCLGWRDDHKACTEPPPPGLLALAGRAFFSRTWIISEFAQAKRLTILCGRYRLNENEVFHCARFWDGLQAGKLLVGRQLRITTIRYDRFDVKITALTMERLLSMYSASDCSNIHDRIFALLSHPDWRMVAGRSKFQPDYRLQVWDVAFQFLIQWVTHVLPSRRTESSPEKDKLQAKAVCAALGTALELEDQLVLISQFEVLVKFYLVRDQEGHLCLKKSRPADDPEPADNPEPPRTLPKLVTRQACMYREGRRILVDVPYLRYPTPD